MSEQVRYVPEGGKVYAINDPVLIDGFVCMLGLAWSQSTLGTVNYILRIMLHHDRGRGGDSRHSYEACLQS